MATHDPMILIDRSQGLSMPLTSVFRDIFENSNEGLCIRDLHQSFLWANRTFLTLLGLNVNSILIGSRLDEVHTSLDRYKSKIIATELHALDIQDICHVFYPALSPVSHTRIISSLSIQPMIDDKGRCTGTYWRISKPPIVGFSYEHDNPPSIDRDILRFKSPFPFFTMSEWNVAWPFYMGWREQDIARKLRITPRHFRRVLQACYLKLSVNSFEEFHNVITTLGWAGELPENTPYITSVC
ncbi:PAS domain-containing protein [Erwinia billingiae]|uniref:PAS domain-containing protein n=1 Tax=Erwinia billingiae TaxID=182337 RepID=UPI003208B75A